MKNIKTTSNPMEMAEIGRLFTKNGNYLLVIKGTPLK